MRYTSARQSADRHGNTVSRATVQKVDDEQLLQELQIAGFTDEMADTIEHAHPYGFVAHPQPPSEDGKAAESFVAHMISNRSHGVVLQTSDRRHRLYKTKPGEVAMHDDQGQWLYLTRDGFLQKAPNDKTHRTQIDKDTNQRGQTDYGQDATKIPDAHAFHSIDKDSRTVRHPKVVEHKIADSDSGQPKHFVKLEAQSGVSTFSEKAITDTAKAIAHNGNTSVTGGLGVSGAATAASFSPTSDARLKSGLGPFHRALEAALAVVVRRFQLHEIAGYDDVGHVLFRDGAPLRGGTVRPSFGVIAQEVRTVIPEIVSGDEATEVLTVNESKLGVIALAALQEFVVEQRREIEALRLRVAQLERR